MRPVANHPRRESTESARPVSEAAAKYTAKGHEKPRADKAARAAARMTASRLRAFCSRGRRRPSQGEASARKALRARGFSVPLAEYFAAVSDKGRTLSQVIRGRASCYCSVTNLTSQ